MAYSDLNHIMILNFRQGGSFFTVGITSKFHWNFITTRIRNRLFFSQNYVRRITFNQIALRMTLVSIKFVLFLFSGVPESPYELLSFAEEVYLYHQDCDPSFAYPLVLHCR